MFAPHSHETWVQVARLLILRTDDAQMPKRAATDWGVAPSAQSRLISRTRSSVSFAKPF